MPDSSYLHGKIMISEYWFSRPACGGRASGSDMIRKFGQAADPSRTPSIGVMVDAADLAADMPF